MGVWKNMNAWFDKQTFMLQIIILIGIVYVARTWVFGLYQVPSGSMETTMLVGERFFADKISYHFRAPKRGDIITFLDPQYMYSENYIKNLWQRYVWGPSNWTKRVIGLPDDHVEGRIEDGKPVLYVNGKKLDEPYLNSYPLVAVWNCAAGMQPNKERLPESQELVGEMIVLKSYDPNYPYKNQPFYNIDENAIIKIPRREPHTPLAEGRDVFDVHLSKGQYWVMGDNRQGSLDSRYWGVLDDKLIHGRVLYRILSLDSREGWLIVDLLKHPLDIWKRVRWNRCLQRVC